jgi:biopolymer transport protein ExbD
MDVGGAKGGVKSDINVTPLVDVMLVLLIIMMLVAPLLQQGVQLTMPEAVNTVDKPDAGDPTVVFVDALSQLYVNTIRVSNADVINQIQRTLEETTERTVYMKADRDAPYSAVMAMMDALREAQIETVGLITEAPNATVAAEGGEGAQ